MIIAVIYATFAVSKRKLEKIQVGTGFEPLTSAAVSKTSRVRILYEPEFFSGFLLATAIPAKVAYVTAMIILHLQSLHLADPKSKHNSL